MDKISFIKEAVLNRDTSEATLSKLRDMYNDRTTMSIVHAPIGVVARASVDFLLDNVDANSIGYEDEIHYSYFIELFSEMTKQPELYK